MRMFRLLAVSWLIAVSMPAAFAAEAAKVTSVVDGDTFKARIGTKVETIRIIGIDTPETVDPRKPVQCFGKEASKQLKQLIAGKTVSLVSDPAEDRDKYKRLLRYVELKGLDIGRQMISKGFAFSYRQYPHPRLQTYNEAEKTAKVASLGLWSSCPANGGDQQTSGQQQRTSAKATSTSASTASSKAATQQCSIKGNISTKGERIYHLPRCGSYKQTAIDESKGERWFCTEAEAQAAGWRKAGNCR